VIVHPTADSRAALRDTVSEAFGNTPIILAPDALTSSDVLVVERIHPRDARALPVTGRNQERPARFRLLKVGSTCVLVCEESGRRFTLRHTECAIH
jgi:hypothetical protein